jgi:hypothetical protein
MKPHIVAYALGLFALVIVATASWKVVGTVKIVAGYSCGSAISPAYPKRETTSLPRKPSALQVRLKRQEQRPCHDAIRVTRVGSATLFGIAAIGACGCWLASRKSNLRLTVKSPQNM